MKEIKFRVRNSTTNKIVAYEGYWLNYGWYHLLIDEINELGDEAPLHSGTYPNDAFEIYYREEYIGIKSKSGIEMYENDILKFSNDLGRLNLHKIFRTSEGGGLVINSHQDDFYKAEETQFFTACADLQNIGYLKQCEVVGDIYLNPELWKR